MAEDLKISNTNNKKEQYEILLPQIENLIDKEAGYIANMANVSAALKQTFDYFWVGFYVVKNNKLFLGPFQGSIACTSIAYGKGVCGTAWQQAKTIIVPDVDAFPGHIACSSLSKSEIVLPIIRNNEVIAVLDIDSDKLNAFDEVDSLYLSKIEQLISF